MRFSTSRRILLALALGTPLCAAHPTETALPSADKSGFEGSFEVFRDLPAPPAVAREAVDLATIEHSHAQPEGAAPIAGGSASYYAAKFHGRRTASGEAFDNRALTAAHRTLPFGSKVRVTNPATGTSVVVRVNDRGPFHANRVIDVSHAAAKRLGLIGPGSARVTLALLD